MWLVLKYRSAKIPKDTQKTQCELHTVEQVLPEEEFSEQVKTSFGQESDVDQEVIINPPQLQTVHLYHISRVLKWTGLSMIVCIIDSLSGRSNLKTS